MKRHRSVLQHCFVCGWHRINRLVSRQSLYPGIALPLGLLFWLLAAFVLVAESNATNLTDGVDGLAAGTAAIALLFRYPRCSHNSRTDDFLCLYEAAWALVQPQSCPCFHRGSLALGGALAAVA